MGEWEYMEMNWQIRGYMDYLYIYASVFLAIVSSKYAYKVTEAISRLIRKYIKKA